MPPRRDFGCTRYVADAPHTGSETIGLLMRHRGSFDFMDGKSQICITVQLPLECGLVF